VSNPRPGGYSIVLTADRTLMARYNVLLDGMLAASQTTATPGFVIENLLLPRAKHTAAGASVAPLGLRRIESALIEGGLDDLIVVDDAHLADVIGPNTKIGAISSGEPVGLGMSSSTMAGVTGGEIYPQAMLRRLLAQVRRLVTERAPGAKVVLGGPGAWQLAGEDGPRQALGVDHAVVGYAEGNAAATFEALLNGDALPPVIVGEGLPAAQIPRLRGATAMGVVEISRGCGLGCEFCTIGTVPMQHLSVEAILADIEANLSAGQTSIAILSEDLLRYGGEGMRCKPEALLGLLTAIRALPEVRALQPDHVNVISLTEYSDEQLAEVRRLIGGRYPWFNIGIETAAGELLQQNGGRPKMGRVPAEDWGEFCSEQLRRLMRLGFVPMASLIVGLPGETPEQVQRTLEWVRSLRGEPLTVFPVMYAPVAGEPPPELTRAHWQLMREAYEFNFRWVPRLYWDQQQQAGVSLARRLVIQALGKGNVVMWRRLLRAKQARACD
jgi:hypothetical protein